MTQIGGVNEYALRTLPLLAGIAVLALLWKVGRRALGEEGAVLATCLGAFTGLLASYATAVKQYSTDALVTLGLIWLVLDVLRDAGKPAAWWRLAIGGVAAMCCSQPAVFVIAGATLALPASPEVRGFPTWKRRFTLTTIAWAGAFALLYVLVYRAGQNDSYLRAFWEPTFLTPGAPEFLRRARGAARAILEAPLVWAVGAPPIPRLVFSGLTGAAFLVGLVSVFRTRGASLALLLAGPYVAVLGAAMVGKYPPADRLLIFAAPLLFLVYAAALAWAARVAPPARECRPSRWYWVCSRSGSILGHWSRRCTIRDDARRRPSCAQSRPEHPTPRSISSRPAPNAFVPCGLRLQPTGARLTRRGCAGLPAPVRGSRPWVVARISSEPPPACSMGREDGGRPPNLTLAGFRARASASGAWRIPPRGCGLRKSTRRQRSPTYCTASGNAEAG